MAKNGQVTTLKTPNELLMCDLFSGLNPERLQAVANMTIVEQITKSTDLERLPDFSKGIYIVLEGRFHIVGSNSRTNLKASVDSLGEGDWWGNPWPQSEDVYGAGSLRLVLDGIGRLAYISGPRMLRIIRDWPDFANATLKSHLVDYQKMQKEFLAAKLQLADTNRILKKIDMLTTMLMSGGIGGQKFQNTVQRKFVLKKLPKELTRNKVEIEQFYLAPKGNLSEDRIRKSMSSEGTKIVRTTRTMDDQSRLEYKNEISEEEFLERSDQRQGQMIRKTRFKPEITFGTSEITLDLFQDPMNGTVLLEASFSDAEAAQKWTFPEELKGFLVNEVTDDPAYSNKMIAGNADQ